MSSAFCAGTSPTNGWAQYDDPNTVYIDVDLSGCGFTQAPIISSSLAGNGNHWKATGGSALYSITATGFRVYVYFPSAITPSDATSWGWNIDWIAAPAPVVDVFLDPNCAGKRRRITSADFMRLSDWDASGFMACSSTWDDSSVMAYQPARGTWWGSFKVAAGHAVDTYGECRGSPGASPEEVGVTSAAGCVSPTYDFNHVKIGHPPSPSPPPPSPALPPPPPPPPPPCDCDYHAGGCSISQPAPKGQACKCNYLGGFTCSGENTLCSNPASPFCQNPDTSVQSCVQGDGDCGGYSGASDCDCDYSPGGCKISQVAPAHTACRCDYMGAFTCDGEVVRCHDETDPLCANPDGSKASCQLGGGDCDGYSECDCDYHAGGCSISQPAPNGHACKCNYLGAFTCGGEIQPCSNPASLFCQNPDSSVSSCVQGGGDCGGYSGASDCDCDYVSGGGFFGSGGGCTISQVAPEGTACHCDYMGAFTCDAEVVRCRNEAHPLCANPDNSLWSCQLGGGDCDGYD